MNKVKELAYWINERESMRRHKEAAEVMGAGPGLKYGWSDDPHMGLVRYCNVRREDDKVTRWLSKNWRPNHHSAWELVLARMLNYIPTLQELSTRDSFNGFCRAGQILKERRSRGDKVFTSAYTISTCGESMDKIDYVMRVVETVKRQTESLGEPDFGSLKSCHEELTCFDGLGSFLAAQVVADMKNTEGHPLQKARDWWEWSSHGPGSLKGLTAYFGTKITPSFYDSSIRECYAEVCNSIDYKILPLHMQDFQNCLCEFSKYERVKVGGHVRNRYEAYK
jgi:hypothetical protein